MRTRHIKVRFGLYFQLALFAWLMPVGIYSQIPLVARGKIVRHENFPSRYVAPRTVDVWLPDNYNPRKKYAVLYMHDGQMLFDSLHNWNKQEWKVDEWVGELSAAKKLKRCIVVAIWNSGKMRHAEYFPQKPFESLPDSGKATILEAARINGVSVFGDYPIVSDHYLKFLVEELKPFIDRQYATHTGPKHTFLAGSSMGGLISLYALCEYPQVFGGAACLSTHWPGIFVLENNPFPDAMFAYMRANLPDPRSHRIYFDCGDQSLDAMYPRLQQMANEIILARGYHPSRFLFRFFPGENHSERAWSKRFDIPLLFLLGR